MLAYDHLTRAQELLDEVREKLLDALLASQDTDKPITSDDFAEINALESKIAALREAQAPEQPKFSFDALMSKDT